MVRRFNTLLVTLLLLMVYAPSWAANISVKTDRDPVAINENFRIIFTAEGSLDGEPDFSPLNKDFQLLGTGQSSQFSMTNGNIRSSKTYTLTVAPMSQGKIKIPPISFGKDKSPEIIVTVVATGSARPQAGPSAPPASKELMFITAEVDSQSPYVQQQILLTLRIYRIKQWKDASLSDPHFEGVETRVQQLGKDRGYETHVKDKSYLVTERTYALFPQQSGDLTITPFRVTARFPGEAKKQRSSGSLFSNDPFFDNFFSRQTYEKRTTQSNPISLKIKSIPAGFTGKHWLPAKDLQLQETWSGDIGQLKVGEPVTRTLAVIGDGVGVGQIPEITMTETAQLKNYPDQPVADEQPTNKGLLSTYTQKFAVIPSQPGKHTIPAIEIPWWNTVTDKMQVARLEIAELAASGDAVPVPEQDSVPATPIEPADKAPEEETRAESMTMPTDRTNTILLAAVIIFALLWLITLLILFKKKSAATTVKPTANPVDQQKTSRKAALQQLHSACDSQQATAIRDALIQWAKSAWPQDPPHNLDNIAIRLPAEAADQVTRLSVSLYGKDKDNWDAEAIWLAIKNLPSEADSNSKTDDDKLEPLYR